MRLSKALLSTFACPLTGAPLEVMPLDENDEGIDAGILYNAGERVWYPLLDGVPVLYSYRTSSHDALLQRWPHALDGLSGFRTPDEPGEIDTEQAYYESAEMWEAVSQIPFDEERRRVALEMVPKETTSLLDVGAGIGLFLREFEGAFAGSRSVGIERSTEALKSAVCRSPLAYGTIEALPATKRSFDLVTSQAVIEHLPYDVHGRALAELERVADKWILIDVPDRERRLQAQCPECGCVFNPHYHMRSYDDGLLNNLFSKFRRIQTIRLMRDTSILAALALPFRRRVFDGFLEFARCPQCDYHHQRAGELGLDRAGDDGWHDLVRRIAGALPTVKTRGEVLVLYERIAD